MGVGYQEVPGRFDRARLHDAGEIDDPVRTVRGERTPRRREPGDSIPVHVAVRLARRADQGPVAPDRARLGVVAIQGEAPMDSKSSLVDAGAAVITSLGQALASADCRLLMYAVVV